MILIIRNSYLISCTTLSKINNQHYILSGNIETRVDESKSKGISPFLHLHANEVPLMLRSATATNNIEESDYIAWNP